MADFRVNLTKAADVDSSILEAFNQSFTIASGQAAILDQFATQRFDLNAKSIELPRFARLAVSTTPLVEGEEPTASKLSDTSQLLIPLEYGRVVTRTKLASLQTGGIVDLAAARVVGLNMAQTMDALFIEAAMAASNVTVATTTMATLDAAYSALVTRHVQPMADGLYIVLMDEASIAGIRTSDAFTGIAKYANAGGLLRNEVGTAAGFRIVRHQDVGAGNSIALGFNAIGKAVSQEPGLVFSGPFDNLGRFVNVGWYGVLAYAVVEPDAIQILNAA